jgi:hypothetical protein
MKRLLYLLLFFFQILKVYGQNDYYSTDSTTSVGIKLIDGGVRTNSRFCQIKKNEEIIQYSPYEVKEYGFKDGRNYFSRIIIVDNKEQKVFLERLNKGKIILYYYKDKNGKKFFIEKDKAQLVELNNDNTNHSFVDSIKFYTNDCEKVKDRLKLIKYRKKSLSRFINQYNSCKNKPIPHIRYGVSIGYAVSQPLDSKIKDDFLNSAVFANDKALTMGLFLDIPILHSHFSFHPEVYYQKNAFSSHSESISSVDDVVINATSINIPLLIRYTLPTVKFRPYLNMGGTFAYNIRNENIVSHAMINNGIINIVFPEEKNVYSQRQIGYSLGGGIQYDFTNWKSIFVELRYNHLNAVTEETFGNTSKMLIIGLNF